MSETTQPSTDAIDSLTYEAARDQLATVVTQLEQGTASLEESIELWERGNALAARCETWLAGAREKIAAAEHKTEQ